MISVKIHQESGLKAEVGHKTSVTYIILPLFPHLRRVRAHGAGWVALATVCSTPADTLLAPLPAAYIRPASIPRSRCALPALPAGEDCRAATTSWALCRRATFP